MKKTFVMIAVVALVVSAGMSAYAYYGNYGHGRGMQGNMYDRQGGMYNQKGGRGRGMQGSMSGSRNGWGRSQGRGRGAGWNAVNGQCPYMASGNQAGPARMNPRNTAQMISEEKVKEAAQGYVTKYLNGYTVDTIEKDSWRPLYFVTLKGDNVEQLMAVHGFSGQVMHVFPKVAE